MKPIRRFAPYVILGVCLVPLIYLATGACWDWVASSESTADPVRQAAVDAAARLIRDVQNDRARAKAIDQLADHIIADLDQSIAAAPGPDAESELVKLGNTRALLRRVEREYPPGLAPERGDEEANELSRFREKTTFKQLSARNEGIAKSLGAAIETHERKRKGDSNRLNQNADALAKFDKNIELVRVELDAGRWDEATTQLNEANIRLQRFPAELRTEPERRFRLWKTRVDFSKAIPKRDADRKKFIDEYSTKRADLLPSQLVELDRQVLADRRFVARQQLDQFPTEGRPSVVVAFLKTLPADWPDSSVAELRGKLKLWFETGVRGFPEPKGWTVKGGDNHVRSLEEVYCIANLESGPVKRLYVGAFEHEFDDNRKLDPRVYNYFYKLENVLSGRPDAKLSRVKGPAGDRGFVVDGKSGPWRAIIWRNGYLEARKQALDTPSNEVAWRELERLCRKYAAEAREYPSEPQDDSIRPTGSRRPFTEFAYDEPAEFIKAALAGDVWPELQRTFNRRGQ